MRPVALSRSPLKSQTWRASCKDPPPALRNGRGTTPKSVNWLNQSANANQFAICIFQFSFCNSLFEICDSGVTTRPVDLFSHLVRDRVSTTSPQAIVSWRKMVSCAGTYRPDRKTKTSLALALLRDSLIRCFRPRSYFSFSRIPKTS